MHTKLLLPQFDSLKLLKTKKKSLQIEDFNKHKNMTMFQAKHDVAHWTKCAV